MEENLGREVHAVAELFPMLRGRAFEELAADIKKNGLREPILLDAEGRIVDGRNRYRACLAAGVEPRFVEWQGEGELAELALEPEPAAATLERIAARAGSGEAGE